MLKLLSAEAFTDFGACAFSWTIKKFEIPIHQERFEQLYTYEQLVSFWYYMTHFIFGRWFFEIECITIWSVVTMQWRNTKYNRNMFFMHINCIGKRSVIMVWIYRTLRRRYFHTKYFICQYDRVWRHNILHLFLIKPSNLSILLRITHSRL